MSTTSSNSNVFGHELLQIITAVAAEKGISNHIVRDAMEETIQKAAKAKYGYEYDIRATIDQHSGDITILKCLTVVDAIENEYTEIDIESAKKYNPDIQLGDILKEQLPMVAFGRTSALVGRQVLTQKFKDMERELQYEEFKNRVGTIVSGVVKRAEYNSVTIDVNRTEAVIKKDQLLPKENFRVGDRVKAYIVNVSREAVGPQVFLSRTHPGFLIQLFTQEVPEIYDGVIEIKSAARDPGSRAKIAVFSKDSSIDPIGACVGVRGARVQGIVQELQGEKVDIVPWSDDWATFAVNALAPAEVSKVVVDEENRQFEILVPDDQLSLAIGRRGQNVRLAAQLIGWKIDVVSESIDTEKRNKQYQEQSQMFMVALDCDEMIARLLVGEGFTTVEELAESEIDEIASIEGFNEDIAEELKERAVSYLKTEKEKMDKEIKSMDIDEALKNFKSLSKKDIVGLAKKGINTLDKLADLDSDELAEMLPNIDKKNIDSIIMDARAHWFLD